MSARKCSVRSAYSSCPKFFFTMTVRPGEHLLSNAFENMDAAVLLHGGIHIFIQPSLLIP